MLKVSFLIFNGKDIEKVYATELQSYFEQLEQTPFTTILIFSIIK
jgi:hypothetical protein